MEWEKELPKLMRVLRRTARLAAGAEWADQGQDSGTAAHCAELYNRVFGRLKEGDASVSAIFGPLPADSSLTVVAMACRQLAAYYDDEVAPEAHRQRAEANTFAFNARSSFRDFWQDSAHDIQDLGEFIRESIAEWVRWREGHREAGKAGAGKSTPQQMRGEIESERQP